MKKFTLFALFMCNAYAFEAPGSIQQYHKMQMLQRFNLTRLTPPKAREISPVDGGGEIVRAPNGVERYLAREDLSIGRLKFNSCLFGLSLAGMWQASRFNAPNANELCFYLSLITFGQLLDAGSKYSELGTLNPQRRPQANPEMVKFEQDMLKAKERTGALHW